MWNRLLKETPRKQIDRVIQSLQLIRGNISLWDSSTVRFLFLDLLFCVENNKTVESFSSLDNNMFPSCSNLFFFSRKIFKNPRILSSSLKKKKNQKIKNKIRRTRIFNRPQWNSIRCVFLEFRRDSFASECRMRVTSVERGGKSGRRGRMYKFKLGEDCPGERAIEPHLTAFTPLIPG